ncbi:MAG TPA: aminomethyl-transferring glycine dehydrogenase subunit GcvPB, partial [Polyangiaceae bacterium]|nr:aminomethyl-transferring glycine dehydrogenase subunit GcvPB [Polyangiaceae bacterium]
MPGVASSGLQFEEPPIFERGVEGRSGVSLDPLDVPEVNLEHALGKLVRSAPAGLPEVSEPEVVRHFVRLSQWNFSIDTQFFPLGSCTMKHNPKVNEWAARLPGFANVHPLAPDALAQGCLEIMVRLQELLAEIVGLHGVNLQPSAGAQGEFTGLMMMRAYHQAQGRSPRKILIPDSAHGTNPASCALNGFEAVPFPTGDNGLIDPVTFAKYVEQAGDDIAGMMLTNPNTLGMYETALPILSKLIHERGGLVYGDGANMNAVLGKARPGDAGVDVMQFNLHKTFTTPHGGGGPGSGPVAFVKQLEP